LVKPLDFRKYSSQPGVLVLKNFFSKAWAIWPLARWLDSSWPGLKSLGAVIHLLEKLAEFRRENYDFILYKDFLMEKKMTQICQILNKCFFKSLDFKDKFQ
jgi:hypothetical protein